MIYSPLFASIEVSENDRRLLVFLIIFLLLTLAIAGGVGYLIRKTMSYQSKRVNSLCTKVLTTKVVCEEKHYKQYASKKSSILYFKQSFIGVVIGIAGLLLWVISSAIMQSWGENMFYYFGNDLFYIFGVNETSQSWNFLNITFHTLVVVNNGGAGPIFVPEHIPYYLETIFFVTSFCWIMVATQAFVSRYFAIQKFAKEAADRTLKDFTFASTPGSLAEPTQTQDANTPTNNLPTEQ
ncbi:MAG: hypothetical protein MJ239_00480 [Bacilli bacterium]|nr:hypothetical protein [Bacilli bacterium]